MAIDKSVPLISSHDWRTCMSGSDNINLEGFIKQVNKHTIEVMHKGDIFQYDVQSDEDIKVRYSIVYWSVFVLTFLSLYSGNFQLMMSKDPE